MLPGEGAETVARAFVRRDGLVVGVLRIGGDLFRDRPYLALDRGAVGGVAEQRVDPALRTVPGGDVVLEQELSEQEPRADVGERLEGEDAMRRLDAGRSAGSSRTMRSTIPPIGSSTSGIQSSSRSGTSGLCPAEK